MIRRVSRFGSSATVEILVNGNRRNEYFFGFGHRRVHWGGRGERAQAVVRCRTRTSGPGVIRNSARRITLAHELIHADRHQRGVLVANGSWVWNEFRLTHWVRPLDYRLCREEALTIGIVIINPLDGVRENGIRFEQGSWQRRISHWTPRPG